MIDKRNLSKYKMPEDKWEDLLLNFKERKQEMSESATLVMA